MVRFPMQSHIFGVGRSSLILAFEGLQGSCFFKNIPSSRHHCYPSLIPFCRLLNINIVDTTQYTHRWFIPGSEDHGSDFQVPLKMKLW